jgi:hypothetical protein
MFLGLEHVAHAEEPRIAGHTDAMDTVDLCGRDRERVDDLLRFCVDAHVLA